MFDQDSITDYFNRVQMLVNGMKTCKEELIDQQLVDKVLRTLTPRFDHVVVVIEESKDLDSMKVEELQNSLEAHEQRINERRNDEKDKEQALQAQNNFMNKGESGWNKKGKGKWKGGRTSESTNGQNQYDHNQENP